MMRRLALLTWVICQGNLLQADTPLLPPADFVVYAGKITISASVTPGTTRITAPRVDWTIPHWLRFVYPSADGLAVLALADSGNLIGSRDPDQIVLTLYRAADAQPLQATLSALMDPADMPQTVSHYAWMDGLVWENGSWTLSLSDGGVIRIDPVSGIFTRQ